ncbi:MAG: YwmB family TATA-box binding protein [Eubacteriales bacterium]|nr:YwmB family TATA-box binding protein [Eubacteriales bacterium]
MTKKVKWSFLILVWGIVGIQLFVNHQQKINHEQVVTAFTAMDSSVVEMVSGYGYFGSMELNESVKKKMLHNLANQLGLLELGPYEKEHQVFSNDKVQDKKEQHIEKIGVSGIYGSGIVSLQLITISEKNQENQQYILMKNVEGLTGEEGKALYHKMKQVYQEIGVEGNVTMEQLVKKEGNLMDNHEQMADAFLKAYDATMVDFINENGICTVYGYMADEKNHFLQNGKKVNMQIVFCYDEAEDQTEIKLGIPMVNSPY